MIDLAIVIVNYNTRDYLRNCLASIYAGRGSFSYEVCVVDNASDDGSAELVATEFPQAQLIQSEFNGGFAYANNLGLRRYGFRDLEAGAGPPPESVASPGSHGSAQYVLLLNPDTVVPADAIQAMLAFLEQNPEVGIVGPKLILESGELDLACRRSFPTPEVSFYRMTGLSRLFPHHSRFGKYNLTYLDPDETAEVDAVVGACMLLRGEAIQDAGLLDETFFMYGEDLDWAYRIAQAGWKVYYYPAATVLHVKRAASRNSAKAQQEFYRAMQIFYEKHYAADTSWWLDKLVVGGIGLKASSIRIRDFFQTSKRQRHTRRLPNGEDC